MMAVADRAAFVEEQYARHGRMVFQLCLRLGCGNRAWAEDVTHEVFVRLLEKIPELDATKEVGGWLSTVAYRCCCDRLKHERRRWFGVVERLAREPTHAEPSPDARLLLSTEASEVAEALGSLPPLERAVVAMRYMEDMSQRQIAAALGYSEGYVSKLLTRAAERLRQMGWGVTHG